MRITARVTTFALATVFCASLSSSAQVADAAGHYEGDISSPAGAMTFQVDLSKGPNGEWLGTLTIPFQKLKGFPLSNVTVKGKDVTFDVATSGGGYFRGELNESGISGEFSTQMGPFQLDLQRSGEARVYPTPKSAAVSRELEGVWNGTLDVDGGMRVVLKLANQSDGSSGGSLISVDENNMTIPVAITQDGSKVNVTLPMIGSSYVGVVNGTELTGTYTTSRGQVLPLTLKRTASN